MYVYITLEHECLTVTESAILYHYKPVVPLQASLSTAIEAMLCLCHTDILLLIVHPLAS